MPKFRLTKDNYYSAEANNLYWSASFVKSMMDCPARAIAELRGEYVRPVSTALLIGSYVDAAFEGKAASFVSEHPEILNSRTRELKADYQKAYTMVKRAQSDKLFCEFVRGRKQTVKTGEIFGLPFKCRFDFYRKGERIVDLKTVKDMEPLYRPGEGRLNFADYWRWPLQMAIYQEIEGNHLPCYLAVITKEDPPNIAVIEIPQHTMDTEMAVLKSKLPYFDAMRRGLVPAERCGKCAYCRATNKLSKVISLDDFEG